MRIDHVTITVKAGRGGNGAVAFLRDAQTKKGGPAGGNGGNGGSIYIEGSHNIDDLHEFRFKKKIEAQSGVDGKGNNLFGKNAPNMTIYLPLGTQVLDQTTGTTYEVRFAGVRFCIASGGKGGRGNNEFKSATNRTPMVAEKGEKGQEKTLVLELKFIADIGVIGLPNAGKSSLLTVLTHATPKVGDYPFTTLEPNIGMFDGHPIADIPGLIEGASEGKGLGIRFLKHIEKTHGLVHCIESTQDDVRHAYDVVRKEFAEYNEALLEKPEIILLTKSDVATPAMVKKAIQVFKTMGKEVLVASIYDQESIDALKKRLNTWLSRS